MSAMPTCRSRDDETGAASAAPALFLAGLGYRVHPLAGKIPLTDHGVHDATCDCATLEHWFGERYPGANLGIACGAGLAVLDVDGDAGRESLRSLVRVHGQLPPTVTALTGSGGGHLYFQTDEPIPCSVAALGPGLDVRGEGGYVVCPPSVHPETGEPYEWVTAPDECPPAPAPQWLLERVRAPSRAKGRSRDQWLELLRGVGRGQRNDAVARLAGKLLSCHELDPYLALELVLAWNRARARPPLSDTEVVRTFDSIAQREARRG